MKLFFSGFEEHQSFSQGYGRGENVTTVWLDPQEFMDRASQDNSDKKKHQWIWLYRGPWTLLLARSLPASTKEEYESQLQTWLAWQRKALKLRHIKKSFMLVNTESTSPASLNTHIGLVDKQPAQQQPLHLQTNEEVSCLAKLTEWIAPELWDVFETLELASILPEGEPMSRNDLQAPEASILPTIAQALAYDQDAPRIAAEQEDEHNELEEENELLLLQLRQAQEELQKTFQAKQSLENDLNKYKQKVSDSENKYKELIESKNKDFSNLRNENDLLLQQLHQVQKELQKTFQAKQSLENDLNKYKQKVSDSENKYKELIESKNKDFSNLRSENDLLLQQLHQVQEELEKYFLANNHLTSSLEQTQKTMDRARIVIASFSNASFQASR